MLTHPPTIPELVDHLNGLGVQLWHNRGKLYVGPLERVGPDERAYLAHYKERVIDYLKQEPQVMVRGVDLVAPGEPGGKIGWEGRMSRKPWHYEVSVVLPSLGAIDLLHTALTCWRRQTVSPYVIVVDSGSCLQDRLQAEALRSLDCEVHSVAAHGWRHSSAPVSAALDLAFAVCQTDYALLTHTDVFPRSHHLLAELLQQLGPSCPVVAYAMSRRHGSAEWAQCPAHTLTLVDMRVMRSIRASWNLLAVLEADNELEERYLGWPDTETQFGRSLRAAGIVPHWLGRDLNAAVYVTPHYVHWRSATTVRQYLPEEQEQRHPGLAYWLRQTRELGVAAPLPASAEEQAAAETEGADAAHVDHPTLLGQLEPGTVDSLQPGQCADAAGEQAQGGNNDRADQEQHEE